MDDRVYIYGQPGVLGAGARGLGNAWQAWSGGYWGRRLVGCTVTGDGRGGEAGGWQGAGVQEHRKGRVG